MGNESIKKRTQKLFIEPLEQRIMLDGAGASTFLDLIDERNQQQIKINSSNKDIYKEGENSNKDIPFTNITRDKIRNDKKNIVFIDSAVEDYETITSSFKENTEFYLINANEDGFKRISEILNDRENIDALHLIGHGSSGQILFGNAFLNNDTIDNYQSTLTSIGQSLTTSGDILFYGCNVASTEQGEILIKKISEITKADIAASDDITGKGGDWELEKKNGIIETKNVQVFDYNNFLGTADTYGIASYNSNVVEKHSATNFKASYSGNGSNDGGQSDHPSDRFMITQEQQHKTSGTFSFTNTGGESQRHNYAATSVTASSTNPINIYLVYLNNNINRLSNSNNWGQITFEHEIIGIYNRNRDTIAWSGVSKDGATYPTSSAQKFNRRGFEDTSTNGGQDDWAVSNNNKTLTLKSDNGEKGDFIRVFTYASLPVANNDTGYINEGETLSVSNSASAVSGTTSGSHSGDVENNDTDSGGHTLTITSVRKGSSEGSGSSGSLGSALSGDYGQLTLNSNGSYSYVANNDISGLESGSTVTDSFNYTISDGLSSDIATITITIIGQSTNDAPSADNETNSVLEDNTVTVTDGASDVLDGDTDTDNDPLTVTQIAVTGSGDNAVTASSTYNSGSPATITGTYGTLTIGADGTYTYVADQSAADDLDAGDIVTDSFTYTVSDGTATDTATLIITVTGINDAPVAVDDTDSVIETTTVTRSSGSKLLMADDSDVDDHDSFTVTQIAITGQSSSGVNAGSSYNSNGTPITGTYGTLTVGADGTYTYVAGSNNGTDSFTYTISDGTATDTATLIITVAPNAAPTVVNDTDSVTEGGTVTETTNSQGTVLSDDSDDDGDNLTVSGTVSQTSATANGGSSITISSPNSASVGSAVTGYYGQLTLDSDGTYSYVANQSTADALDGGESGTDVFTFTVSDGTTTTSSTITFTVNGIFQASSTVEEDGSVSVTDGGSASNPSAVSVAATTTMYSLFDRIRFINFNDDGTKLIGLNIADDQLDQFHLATPYDFSSYTSHEAQSIAGSNSSPVGLAFSRDGLNVYTAKSSSGEDTLIQTTLSTAWDTETVSSSADTTINLRTLFGIGSSEYIRGISTSEDGTEFYIITSGDKIHQITLGTPWDISSYLTPDVEYDFSSTGPSDNLGMHFSPNGKKLFIFGRDEKMYEYTLETEWHLSSGVTYEGNLLLSEINSTNVGSFTFSKDGSRLIVLETPDDNVVEYTLSTPFSLISVDQTKSAESITTVSSIRTGQSGGSGTSGSINTALTGTYGQLTIQSNGSYTYLANQDAADALDPGDVVYDYFTINGNTELTITVVGINDTPSADNETNSVDVSSTLTVTDDDTTHVLSGDTDDDTDAYLTVSAIRIGSSEGSGTAGTIGSALTGSYGALTMAADGTYTYVAGSSAGTDSFNYTVTDEFGATDIATLTITVNAVNNAPTASNSTVYINENNQVSSAGDRTPSNITKYLQLVILIIQTVIVIVYQK
jgi:VCBS repeat-containing protein